MKKKLLFMSVFMFMLPILTTCTQEDNMRVDDLRIEYGQGIAICAKCNLLNENILKIKEIVKGRIIPVLEKSNEILEQKNKDLFQMDDTNVDTYKSSVIDKDTSDNVKSEAMTIDIVDNDQSELTINDTNMKETSMSNTVEDPANTSQQCTSNSTNEYTPMLTWAMSEEEMTSYAKKCILDLGFIWSTEATKDNSGWFAPTIIKIEKSDSEIKDLIKISVDATCGLLNPESYGIKGYFEKVDDNTYNFYVLY